MEYWSYGKTLAYSLQYSNTPTLRYSMMILLKSF
jgi:hypothetical protein